MLESILVLFMENKYKYFSDFNCDSRHFAEYVRKNTIGMSVAQQIEFARKVYTKDLLNSRLTVGFLSDDVKNMLGSNAKLLNFSMDNMIKTDYPIQKSLMRIMQKL